MATSFEEIYCLNDVIKADQRLIDKPSYALYELYWKYLQYAISLFQFDCRKDLLDLVPFSLTEYSFTGDGENNIFSLSPAPTITNPSFYISVTSNCEKEITEYVYDETNHTITLTGYTPQVGEAVAIDVYTVGQFNTDLDYLEKTILARAMNLPYLEEQRTNSKILNFATYGGSVKMHSQAEQLKTIEASLQNMKDELEGDISNYSYRTAPVGLRGLGGRTVCLNPLRYKTRQTASE